MSKTQTTKGRYRVSYVIKVDAPEKRDSTYPKVAPGAYLTCSEIVYGRKRALAVAAYWMSDDNVFGSEYVCRVQVLHEMQGRPSRWHLHQTRERGSAWIDEKKG
jgi:hypothetical protein